MPTGLPVVLPAANLQPRADQVLAVVPLENASQDPEMEYLSDGIT